MSQVTGPRPSEKKTKKEKKAWGQGVRVRLGLELD